MIQWMIAKFILRQALSKFVRDVLAHVKAGGWNQKVPKVKTKKNFRGRFETPTKEPTESPVSTRDNIGDGIMNGQQIAGFVRHILTFAGGWAVAQGYVDESTAMEGVGAVATLVGLAWSWWSKIASQPQA